MTWQSLILVAAILYQMKLYLHLEQVILVLLLISGDDDFCDNYRDVDYDYDDDYM